MDRGRVFWGFREARDTFATQLFDYWGRRDPIGLYEAWLERRGVERVQRRRQLHVHADGPRRPGRVRER